MRLSVAHGQAEQLGRDREALEAERRQLIATRTQLELEVKELEERVRSDHGREVRCATPRHAAGPLLAPAPPGRSRPPLSPTATRRPR